MNMKASKKQKRGTKNSEDVLLTTKLEDIGVEIPLVDVEIQFIGALGLPKMDIFGSADAYFVARIDGRVSFMSHVARNSLAPVWNEVWRVKNVPVTASVVVEIFHKFEGPRATDATIGKFHVGLVPGTKEVEIKGHHLALRKSRGTFWMKIDSEPSTMDQKHEFKYLFDGPIRFTRHFSPMVGYLTSGRPSDPSSSNDARLYSTWKFSLKAAQKIFGHGPASHAIRGITQAGHRMLYAHSGSNTYGTLDERAAVSLTSILNGGSTAPKGSNERIKPAVYTYVISSEDNTLRFSETGTAFCIDFASKHALQSNCAQHVWYAGEFHPRPVGGWENFSEEMDDEGVEWELVVDNNSGTYAPGKRMLQTVRECLEYNFGLGDSTSSDIRRGFRVVVYDREDERLVQSREACKRYAVNVRGVTKVSTNSTVTPSSLTIVKRTDSLDSEGQESELRDR
ncbi:hypothetical protein H1R20_g193, partial [Candolleomyces eurysporus]